MKNFKKIVSLLILVPFWISTMGFIIYESQCCCTGVKDISIFVAPETCKKQNHIQFKEEDSNNGCCTSSNLECETFSKECQCDPMAISYFKLKDNIVDEYSNYISRVNKKITTQFLIPTESLANTQLFKSEVFVFIEPPPKIYSCSEYLNFICHRKIPSAA